MKILISVQYFNPPVGGAEISLYSIAKELAKNHEVIVLQAGTKNDTQWSSNIIIETRKVPIYDKHWLFSINNQCNEWAKIIDGYVREIKPDLIITQNNFTAPTVDIATIYDVPVVTFIRSYEHFCPIAFTKGTDCSNRDCKECITLRNKLRYKDIEQWLDRNKTAIKDSEIVIANSKFVANITKQRTGKNPYVIYPTINLDDYKDQNEGKEYITMVNPSKGKGKDIFLKIAKSMPEKRFLAIKGNKILEIEKFIHKLDNLTIVGWTNDIKEYYSQTKIMLVPAIWEEPFGRIVVEAEINGIPVIASKRGGLPEAVGKGGIIIKDLNNIDEWKKAINSLDNKSKYNKLSNNAIKHAETFDFESNFEKFKDIINKELNIKL